MERTPRGNGGARCRAWDRFWPTRSWRKSDRSNGFAASGTGLVRPAGTAGVRQWRKPTRPAGRHVGHIGRRTLKWAFIEALMAAVRSGGRFRKIFDAYTDGGKKNRNRGYIVVGHELCRIGYAMSGTKRSTGRNHRHDRDRRRRAERIRTRLRRHGRPRRIEHGEYLGTLVRERASPTWLWS